MMTKHHRWIVLAVIASGLLLVAMDSTILFTALPLLTQEIGADATQSLWIVNAYPVVMAGLLLSTGALGDRVGHRRMFMLGLMIFGLASLWAALSPSAISLIVARAVLAVGAASMMPSTLALIRLTFDDEQERNLAISLWGSVALIGAIIGPILGGSLISRFWWGSIFIINVPIVLLALLAMLRLAPPNRPNPNKKLDYYSSVLALITLVAATLAFKEFAHSPSRPTFWAVTLLVAILGAFLFYDRQRQLDEPLLDFSIFRNRAFSAGVIAAVFAMFAIGGLELITTQRYQLVAGFSPTQAGLLVSLGALGALPTSMIAGALLRWLGLLVLIAGGFSISSLGIVFSVFGVTYDLLVLMVLGLLLLGAGAGAAMSCASIAIMGNVPPQRAGMGASIEEVSYEFGALSAVTVLGTVLTSIYRQTVQLPPGTNPQAAESIADALALAPQNPQVFAAVTGAFDLAYLAALYLILGIMLLTLICTSLLLRPYKPGSASQLYAHNH